MTIFDAAGVGLSLLWNAAAVAQTSATGEPWEGRWASSPAACQQVTCTGETDCDGAAYSFEGEIFRGVPGYFTCVIAGESSDPEGTVLPLSCAAEGTPYLTAIRLKWQNGTVVVQWAREPSPNPDSYQFESDAIALVRCPG
jgi:hypothetical protein